MKAETSTTEKSAGPGRDSVKTSRDPPKQQTALPVIKPIVTKSDPLEKVKKEDLLAKLKEYEDKIKADKESAKKAIESKNKEIENKDKVIFSISGSNRKLVSELEELKREVDEKLDKVGLKQLKEIEKEKERERKRQPLEHVLKVKEKELKNALQLLEVFKKDKENLQKNLDEKSEFQKYVKLQDKLKEEEGKTSQLESEIKGLNKLKEEHNKCESLREEMERDRKQVMTEMKYLKEKNRDLIKKLKEEEEKSEKLNKVMVDSKVKTLQGHKGQNSVANLNLNIGGLNNPNLPNINKDNPKSNSDNLQKYWNLLESADKIRDDTSVKKASAGNADNQKKNLNKEKHKFSVSLQNKNFRIAESAESRPKLFGVEEKKILSKLLPVNEIAKLEKRFEAIDLCKVALERKNYTETKSLNKKIVDLAERLELATLQNKEVEQKNKILSFQINEHKNENRILTRKIAELNGNVKSLNKALRDREEENKKLILQITDARKKEEPSYDVDEPEADHEPEGEREDYPVEVDDIEEV